MALLCLAIGLGLIVYGSGGTYEVMAPGPLSSPHAERLAHQGNDRCASCHPQAHQNLGQWVAGFLGTRNDAQQVTQTDLCLDCHQRDMCSDHARFAHNIAPEILDERSAELSHNGASRSVPVHQVSGRSLLGSKFKSGQTIACATCHREHHGQAIDMKAMTDQHCQSCHGQTFHSFESDHPEFKNWPSVPEAGIRFDHSTHHFKHFPQGNRPFECAQCHRDDKQGNVQQLVGFDQACGSCHQGQIDLSTKDGLAWLQLPGLDVPVLQAANHQIGHWPESLSHGFDGRLTPFTELLLRADTDAVVGLTVLGPGFDFLDLDTTDDAQTKAAAQVAWGIKRLIADLSLRGREAIRHRLQIALGQPIGTERLARLSQNFSPTLVQDSANRWFPPLWDEVTADEVAPISMLDAVRQTKRSANPPSPSQLVIPDDVLARLMHPVTTAQDRPQELLIENPLTGVWGSAEKTGGPRSPAQATQPQATQDRSSQEVGRGSASQESRVAARAADLVEDDPNLLAQNPLANYGQQASQSSEVGSVRPSADPGGGGEAIGAGTRRELPPDESQSGRANPSPSTVTPPIVAPPAYPTDRVGPNKLVGWVRDDTNFSLEYHLDGHADAWLKEWIDVLLERQSAGDPQGWLSDAVAEIAGPEKAGNCLQCHGNHSGVGATASVSWTGKYRDPSLKGWTKFNHRPHTLLPGLSDCRSCHQLREFPAGQGGPEAALATKSGDDANIQLIGFRSIGSSSKESSGLDAPPQDQAYRSDFHSLTKSQCASCHQSGSTRNSCTTCHNYHIGQRVQD